LSTANRHASATLKASSRYSRPSRCRASNGRRESPDAARAGLGMAVLSEWIAGPYPGKATATRFHGVTRRYG
jgi:hypothetical protein